MSAVDYLDLVVGRLWLCLFRRRVLLPQRLFGSHVYHFMRGGAVRFCRDGVIRHRSRAERAERGVRRKESPYALRDATILHRSGLHLRGCNSTLHGRRGSGRLDLVSNLERHIDYYIS